MTAPSMAEVLAKHAARWDHDVSYYMPVACECGVERPDGDGSDELWHAEHQAQALADAGFGHVASVKRKRDDLMALAVEATRRRGEAIARAEAAEAKVVAVRKVADEWEVELGRRAPLDREGTCDGCAETKHLVSSYSTPDSEPWLCAECDTESRRHFADLRRALDGEATP